MKFISPERKLRFLSTYMNEYIDAWPKKIKPFDRWLESTLDKRINNGNHEKREYQKCICHYCRREFDENRINKTKDHIIPISKGGYDKKENRVPCCFDCNQWKDDMYLEDWLKAVYYFIKKGKERNPYDIKTLGLMVYNIKKIAQYAKDNNSTLSLYRIP